jgi:hypothetical protein
MSTETEILSNENENIQVKEKQVSFWGYNPNELLNPSHILELFPTQDMQYAQKLNAITRLVIVLCLVFYFILRKSRVVIVGVLTLVAIWLVYISQKKK